jgi:hypothetical protein
VGVIATFGFAALCKKKMLSLAATIMFGFLIIYYPLWLFVQLWFPDIYFYLYESLVLVREAHFGIGGHSAEAPGISLMSGSYLMITNADPIAYAKIYQGMFIIVTALLLYGIASKMNVSNPSLAPLIFFSIVWQDEIQFCRLSFALILYLAFLLLLLRKQEDIDKRIDVGNVLMSSIVAFVMVLSHPAAPLFLLLNIMTAILLIKIFVRKSSSYIKELLLKAGIVAVAWFSWNISIQRQGAISTLITFGNIVIESMFAKSQSQLQTATTKLSSSSYTPAYYNVVLLHLIHWVLIFSLAVLAFFVYHFHHEITSLTVSGFLLSSQSTAIIFFLGGLDFFSRPSLFTYIAFAPLAAFVIGDLLGMPRITLERSRFKKKFQTLLATFTMLLIVFSAMIVPVMKYADTPMLYMPTREHYALQFALKNLPSNQSLVSTSYNTPSGFYSLLLQSSGGQKGSLTYTNWVFLIGSNDTQSAAVLALPSVINRDAFLESNQTYRSSMDMLLNYLPNDHSRIYDAGENVSLFVPNKP